jgi:hypothetical protein
MRYDLMIQAKCDSNPETAAVRLETIVVHIAATPPAFPVLVETMVAAAATIDGDRGR